MEKFHIEITNNETGETLTSLDTCAIIGAIDAGGPNTKIIGLIDCNSVCLAATVAGAQRVVNQIIKKLPITLRWQIKKLLKEKH